MQAVIVTGGKQYSVKEGDVIFKYRPKKDSKSIRGHRQPYTKVQIEKISV